MIRPAEYLVCSSSKNTAHPLQHAELQLLAVALGERLKFARDSWKHCFLLCMVQNLVFQSCISFSKLLQCNRLWEYNGVFLVFLCVLTVFCELQVVAGWNFARACWRMYSSRPPKENPSRLFFCGFVGVVFGHKFKVVFQTFHLVPVPNSAQTLDMDQNLLSTVLKYCDARLVHLKDPPPPPPPPPHFLRFTILWAINTPKPYSPGFLFENVMHLWSN